MQKSISVDLCTTSTTTKLIWNPSHREHIPFTLDQINFEQKVYGNFGCFLAVFNAMLKRRASKRFVLAESGQEDVAWDSTLDNENNEQNTNADSPNSENDSIKNMPKSLSVDSGLK